MRNGTPTWHPENPGEKLAVKRPDHLINIVRDDEQLTEEVGARLARWASGNAVDPIDAFAKLTARKIKELSGPELQDWWNSTLDERTTLKIPKAREDKMADAVAKKVAG